MRSSGGLVLTHTLNYSLNSCLGRGIGDLKPLLFTSKPPAQTSTEESSVDTFEVHGVDFRKRDWIGSTLVQSTNGPTVSQTGGLFFEGTPFLCYKRESNNRKPTILAGPPK